MTGRRLWIWVALALACGCETESWHEMGCGDGVMGEGELCDGYELGNLTCRDVEGNDPQGDYTGKPACNLTCDGLRMGTCARVSVK